MSAQKTIAGPRPPFTWLSALVSILVLSGLLLGCDSSGPAQDDPEPEPDATTLRGRAEARGFILGASGEAHLLSSEATYRDVLAREFNMTTPGNVMKWQNIHPGENTYNWTRPDEFVAFAEANGMAVRGHTLVWHSQLASWVENRTWTRQELINVMGDHITTVMTRYKGRIAAWDVVNEAIGDDARRRPSVFQEVIGPEYIQLAFQIAHAADPDAKLFYNDYSAEASGAKSDAVYNLMKELIDAGTPIHGVGLQMHLIGESPPSSQAVRQNIRRLGELGLDVHITEMDVRMRLPVTNASLVTQAGVYDSILRVCLTESACSALIVWGFTDKHSWIPSFFPGYGAALPFDENYQPKLAYQVMMDALAN